MPRRRRHATAGLVFHVVNRAVRRARLFDRWEDYQAFERILVETVGQKDVALYDYCIMPNHFHLLVCPRSDGALSSFMHRLETTHASRWNVAHGTVGEGSVYGGRFKDIPVQDNEHFVWVARYIERNALRANLTARAEHWLWSSLWQRQNNPNATWLSEWPCPRPANWIEAVNTPQTAAELEAFRRACRKGQPYGDPDWQKEIRQRLGIPEERRRGRPRKNEPDPITKSSPTARPK